MHRFFPMTLAYVLVVQRAMDIRVLLRLGTKYLLAKATIFLLQVAIALTLVLRLIVPMRERKEHQTLYIVLLLAITALVSRAFFFATASAGGCKAGSIENSSARPTMLRLFSANFPSKPGTLPNKVRSSEPFHSAFLRCCTSLISPYG